VSRSTVPPVRHQGWFLRFNPMFGDAHNRLYSTLALYRYAHSLVKRLIWTTKVSPVGAHANPPATLCNCPPLRAALTVEARR
jgi:hypothetical protein